MALVLSQSEVRKLLPMRTCIELMGQALPGSLQGQSRVSEMTSGRDLQDDVFIEWNGADGHPPSSFGEAEVNRSMAQPSRTVVSAERWKLNLYEGGPGELYDLNTDPHELDNLFGQERHAGRLRDLARRILEWQDHIGDTAPVSVPCAARSQV